MAEWYPIATVPPNTPVLVYVQDTDLMLVSRWQTHPSPHWRGYPWLEPTHWHPLPEPPQAPATSAEIIREARGPLPEHARVIPNIHDLPTGMARPEEAIPNGCTEIVQPLGKHVLRYVYDEVSDDSFALEEDSQ
jgi:hypothetical protein